MNETNWPTAAIERNMPTCEMAPMTEKIAYPYPDARAATLRPRARGTGVRETMSIKPWKARPETTKTMLQMADGRNAIARNDKE